VLHQAWIFKSVLWVSLLEAVAYKTLESFFLKTSRSLIPEKKNATKPIEDRTDVKAI
jgi:hypothetical protein